LQQDQEAEANKGTALHALGNHAGARAVGHGVTAGACSSSSPSSILGRGGRAGAAGLEFVNVHGFGEHGLKETAHSADPRANVSERLVPRPGTGPLALSNDDVGLALDSPTEWVAFDVRCVVCRRGSEQVGSRETGPAAARVRCHAPRTSGSRG